MEMEMNGGFAAAFLLAVISKTEYTENFHSWLSDLHPASPLKLLLSYFTINLQRRRMYICEDSASEVTSIFLIAAEATKYASQNLLTCQPALNSK